jgi:GWxTD domain-containing protein
MNFLINTPMAEAIGWTLVHSLWEGALIAAALAATLAAFRSPRARYGAACLALLVMLGAFLVTLVHLMPDHVQGLRAASAKAFPAWRAATDWHNSVSPQTGLAAIIPWLTPLWLAGVCIFCVRHMAGWISIGRLRRRGVCSAPEHWQSNLTRLHASLRLSRPVLLLESCLAETPMVLGHFRPVILMPIGVLAGLPTSQIEAILLHELAHIRRCDYLVNLCQRLVEGLLFYHPAVWWISRVIRTERENCCDDAVVAWRGDAHGYAVALAALEQNRWSGPEPAVAATGGNLMKRIHRLLYPKGPAGIWSSLIAIVILIASATVVMAAWQSEPPRPTEQVERSPFSKWLNEDAVYIITDQERTAFLKLTSDEEKQHFIEQFWLRRDPTPGTQENEYKEEHYKRIAFANKHFQTHSGKPGWQTDRGHMWIVYGPPDEYDSHPAGDAQTPFPFDMWRYSHVEGIGDNPTVTFIDRNKTGDFGLAPGKPL